MGYPDERRIPFPLPSGDWGVVTHVLLGPDLAQEEAAMSTLEEAFAEQCADLKPRLTPDFCETLVLAARTFAWQSEDYEGLVEFITQCLELGGQSVLIDLSPFIQLA